MPQYGYKFNRVAVDSTLHIPSFCGVPNITDYIKNGMVAIDTCNNVLFQWTRSGGWTPISTGTYLDTISLSNRINGKIDSLRFSGDSVYAIKNRIINGVSSTINTFQYKNPYFKTSDTIILSNRINQKLNSVDTASMLSKYLRIFDTTSMLSKYLRKSDTASLSNRINLKLNISDTASMLSKYLRIFDTTSMLSKYLRRSDTTSMLSGYVRKSVTIATTSPLTGGGSLAANRTLSIQQATTSQSGFVSSTDFLDFKNKVDTIYKNNTNDSIIFTINDRRNAIISGGSDTAKVVIAEVYNAEATTLQRGEVVYLFAANGDRASVKRAYNIGDSTSAKTFGFVRDSIQAGQIGVIVTQGQIGKLNLGAYTQGQTIYLDSIPGQFTAIKPIAPKHLVTLGVVERANAGNGLIYVKPVNGFELDELHNVSVNGTKNKSVLYYDSTNRLWKATNGPTVTKIKAGTNITLTYPATGVDTVTINAVSAGITSVTAASPLSVTNPTTAPFIGISQATTSQDGYLTSTDWNTFNGKVSSVSASGLLTSTGGTNPTISSSVSANKLIGRNPSTSGVMQEITLGSGLSLTGTTLSATGGGGGGGSQNLQQVLDTGYTLNGNFYFQTNTTDSIINLSGTRLTASRVYDFPDSSGILALKSDLNTPTYQIDLTSANYTITNAGVYKIKIATDSTTPYYIEFPNPASFTGQRITLINNDDNFINNAIIDTTSYAPKYQGTERTIWDIPYGMTYEFVSIDNKWMCTNPMPVYVDTFASDYDGTGITTYNIPFGGTYKLTNIDGSKQNDYYIVNFPDPKKNNGERITLINADTIYSLKIEGTWIPFSKNMNAYLITKVAPQSTYEFVSIDSQWICVSMSKPPTFPNIDMSIADFKIQSDGVYRIIDASANALIFPDPTEFDGKTIIIINTDDTYDASVDAANQPLDAAGTAITIVPVFNSFTFVSISGKWYLISVY